MDTFDSVRKSDRNPPSPADLTRPVIPTVMGRRWRTAAKAAGLDGVRLHDLRHLAATQGLALGGDVRTVAGRLGHANPTETLRTYAHFLPVADRDLADRLGQLLDGPER